MVQGNNADGTIVAVGSAVCTVIGGGWTEVKITVTPLSGTGDFSFSISWDDGSITTPTADCTLMQDGSTIATPACTVSGNSATASVSALDSGYYTLFSNLYNSGDHVWGMLETIRIVSGCETIASLTADLNEDELGNIDITIAVDLQNPITLTFDSIPPTLTEGSSITISVTASEAVDSFAWYVDNSIAETDTAGITRSITIGNDLEVGNHRLNLLVKSGLVLSSDGFSFTVE